MSLSRSRPNVHYRRFRRGKVIPLVFFGCEVTSKIFAGWKTVSLNLCHSQTLPAEGVQAESRGCFALRRPLISHLHSRPVSLATFSATSGLPWTKTMRRPGSEARRGAIGRERRRLPLVAGLLRRGAVLGTTKALTESAYNPWVSNRKLNLCHPSCRVPPRCHPSFNGLTEALSAASRAVLFVVLRACSDNQESSGSGAGFTSRDNEVVQAAVAAVVAQTRMAQTQSQPPATQQTPISNPFANGMTGAAGFMPGNGMNPGGVGGGVNYAASQGMGGSGGVLPQGFAGPNVNNPFNVPMYGRGPYGN